jgi:hypothetical protein
MSDREEYLEEGIREGWGVSWLTMEEWDDEQLWQIRQGLEDGLDAKVYAKKAFDWRQMEQVRYRLRKEKKE